MKLSTSPNFKFAPVLMMTMQCLELSKHRGSNRATEIVMAKFAASVKQLSDISLISGQLL